MADRLGLAEARAVVEAVEACAGPVSFTYPDELPLAQKVKAVARRIYDADTVTFDAKARKKIEQLEAEGYGHLPVCIAKTQSSFSTDPTMRGAPSGHTVNVREVRLSAGAGFVVMLTGEIMTMPGLPKVPASEHIDIDDEGRITGLS